jgi:iron complex outermembrane receptor protein
MHARKLLTLILISSVVLTGRALFGQVQEEQTDPFHPKTTVVVTATRSEVELDKSPVSTNVLTQKEIESRPMQTLDQHISLMEGLYAFRTQGPSATDAHVSLRGFNGSARTLVLLDGHPINDSYTNSVNWTGLPVGEIQTVEVARGPSSSLYGGNALGGVINIVTKPIEKREFELTGQYGRYSTANYSARYSDRLFNRLGITFGYQRFQTEGYNSRVTTSTPAAATGTGIPVTGVIPITTSQGAASAIIGRGGLNWLNKHTYRAKGDYTFNSSTLMSAQYIRQQYSYGYTGYRSDLRDLAGNVVDNGTLFFTNSTTGAQQRLTITPTSFLQGPGEQRSNFYSATVQHEFSNRQMLRLDGSLYHIPTYQFRSAAAGSNTVQGRGTVSDGERRSYHANVQYQTGLTRQTLIFGGETRHDMASNANFALANWLVKASRLNQTFFAIGRSINQSVYVQDQVALTDQMNLTFGGRYDYWKTYDGQSNNFNATSPQTFYPERSSNKFSGKVALSYALPRDFHLRASAGTAFRNPNVNDLYATSISGGVTIFRSNPALKPENTKSWEVGVRKRFAERTDLDVAYYENHITDLIYRQTDLVADPAGNIRVNVNAGGGRTRGIETALRQQLFTGLQFRASYTFIDAKITKNSASPVTVGKRVTFVPEHMASGQLLYLRGKWTGSLTGRYTGAVFSTDTNLDVRKGVPGAYDPFFVMDSTIGYTVDSRTQVFVSGENLLNRRYFNFYLSQGRMIYAGLKIRI